MKHTAVLKNILLLLLLLSMLFSLAACSGNDNKETAFNPVSESDDSASVTEQSKETQNTETEEKQDLSLDESVETDSSNSNILIAYFSRTGENYSVGVIEKGNTHIIADMIGEELGADMFEITTVTPYPDTYDECTDVAKKEQEENARPEIVGSVENMDDYDVIFLGYPIWWSDMPMAVYTFLESYDFSGKTIVPFCTHEGSGLSSTENSIAEVCPNAEVQNGLSIRGTVAQNEQDEANEAVMNWLNEIGFID